MYFVPLSESTREFRWVYILAYIADRPERHANAILCQLEGGHFGKWTLWSANIDDKHLPYCNK